MKMRQVRTSLSDEMIAELEEERRHIGRLAGEKPSVSAVVRILMREAIAHRRSERETNKDARQAD